MAIITLDKNFERWVKLSLTAVFTVLVVWTVYYFFRCHTGYLQLRNAQRKLQKAIGLKDGEVLPSGWLEQQQVNCFNRFWGWGYYAFIAISFWAALLAVIWLPVVVKNS